MAHIIVQLGPKGANRIYHESHPEHPHKPDEKVGEVLVVAGRRVKVARTPGVASAIMQGILEEVPGNARETAPLPELTRLQQEEAARQVEAAAKAEAEKKAAAAKAKAAAEAK